jgi:5-methylcytosine-specific restriction endonuclease McrA
MPECLCPDGRAIDPDLRGSTDMWAPSIDHIIPLAQGGRDSDGNTRAAHRRCNEAAAGIGAAVVRPDRPAGPLTYSIADLFPGNQGSAWS